MALLLSLPLAMAAPGPGSRHPSSIACNRRWPPCQGSSSFLSTPRPPPPPATTAQSAVARPEATAAPSALEPETDTFSKYSGYIASAVDLETQLRNEYDPPMVDSVYRRRPFLLARRIIQIGLTLGRWAALRYLDSLSGRSDSMFKKRAGELRAALVQLGPAFVKIAQAVSSRPDVISPVYLEELALLQDRIAPFSTKTALGMIEQELGTPVATLFSEITPQPVAAASLGQVYQARLRANGKTVAVKVQRPGVRAAIALDIYILRTLAYYARKAGRLNTDLQAVVDEWAGSLFREMDYEAEARNGARFRKMFGALPDVVIPEMYPELSSRKVLVMEWVEGQRLSEVNDLHLVEVGVYCSLTQLLDCGFYHADPHPGNLMRTYDGKLAYLDFGMMGEMKQNFRDSLIEACVHLVNRDFDALAQDFVSLGLLPPTAQASEVSEALTGVFQNAVSKGVQNISFGDLSGNLGRTMYRFKFRIPSYFSLVIRSLTVLEGIALINNPNYKVLNNTYPWIARKMLTDDSPQLRSTLRALLYKDGEFRIDRLESLITESLKSATTDSLAEKETPAENDTRNVIKRIMKFALSDEGYFVRETLLNEVSKGLDALSRAIVDSTSEAIISSTPLGGIKLPALMETEDFENLATLERLSSLLNKQTDVQKIENGSLYSTQDQVTLSQEVSHLLERFSSSSDLLPMLFVVSELPLPYQQQALQLPVDLIGRWMSRVIARNLRGSIGRAAQVGRLTYELGSKTAYKHYCVFNTLL